MLSSLDDSTLADGSIVWVCMWLKRLVLKIMKFLVEPSAIEVLLSSLPSHTGLNRNVLINAAPGASYECDCSN